MKALRKLASGPGNVEITRVRELLPSVMDTEGGCRAK